MRLHGPVLPGNRWDLAPLARPGTEPRVTVVVTHYEQPVELARTLHALARQTDPAQGGGRMLLEVVVSDDGSRSVPRVPPGTRLVRQEHDGFGAARARNAGACAATGDVLVFLDADTTPEPGFVAAMTRLPGVLTEAVVVGRRRHADLSGVDLDADLAVVAPARELGAPAWLSRGYRETRDLLGADETSFRFVISAVLACRADFFAEVGGFDETFTAYGGEDWEWAHRAWTHGALLAHEPAAVAWHDGPDRADRPGRSGASDRARLLAETTAVARRVPVPGVAPVGLVTPGAPDPVVNLDPTILGDALVLSLDSLLAAWPRSLVGLTAAQRALVPDDPRLRTVPEASGHSGPPGATGPDSDPARSAWRHLQVHRAVVGDRTAWRAGAEKLAGPGAPGWVAVHEGDGGDGSPALVWSSLRSRRRAARWGTTSLDRRTEVASDLRAVPAHLTAQAGWGGWG